MNEWMHVHPAADKSGLFPVQSRDNKNFPRFCIHFHYFPYFGGQKYIIIRLHLGRKGQVADHFGVMDDIKINFPLKRAKKLPVIDNPLSLDPNNQFMANLFNKIDSNKIIYYFGNFRSLYIPEGKV